MAGGYSCVCLHLTSFTWHSGQYEANSSFAFQNFQNNFEFLLVEFTEVESEDSEG
jgi:hypothetical protein